MAKKKNHSRRILITGAAGRIGRVIIPQLIKHFWIKAVDKVVYKEKDINTRGEWIKADLCNFSKFLSACKGVDTIIHLAHEILASDDDYMHREDPNFIMTENLFAAARDSGCRRVIYASSIHAVDGYPKNTVVTEEMAPRPRNRYGVNKAFGEALAAYESSRKYMSCLVIRIGVVHLPGEFLRLEDPLTLCAYVSCKDLNDIIMKCINAPNNLKFGVFHAISCIDKPRFSLEKTSYILGYSPADKIHV